MESPIPKRLKEARKSAKISQKKLGIQAGMDEFSASARMNHYEIGRHTPDYATMRRIARALKLPTAYFYADEDDLARIIKLAYQMSESERSHILKNLSNSE